MAKKADETLPLLTTGCVFAISPSDNSDRLAALAEAVKNGEYDVFLGDTVDDAASRAMLAGGYAPENLYVVYLDARQMDVVMRFSLSEKDSDKS
jgi:hypothetical protein